MNTVDKLLTEENLRMLWEKIERSPSLSKLWEKIPEKDRPALLERVYHRAVLEEMKKMWVDSTLAKILQDENEG